MTTTSTVVNARVDAPVVPSRWAKFRFLVLRLPILQFSVLLALILWLVISIPAFVNRLSIVSVLILAALLALAALGQTFVVLIGGLDLAIPGYIIVGAFISSNLAGGAGWPIPLALLMTVLICGLVGAFVGFVSHRYNIQPLVLTLGINAALVGGTLFVAKANFTSAPPDALRALTAINGTTFGLAIPPILLIVLAAVVMVWLFLTRTASGRRLYATGTNARAAELTRVHTGKVWTLTFATSGITAGVAGMFIASFSAGWSANIGEPYFFTGLAAVLLGGTTFGSIHASYTRTVLGALILTLLSTIVLSVGMSESESRIIYGFVVIAAAFLYGRERHVRNRF